MDPEVCPYRHPMLCKKFKVNSFCRFGLEFLSKNYRKAKRYQGLRVKDCDYGKEYGSHGHYNQLIKSKKSQNLQAQTVPPHQLVVEKGAERV